MSDLEQSIAEWRRQVRAAGIKAPALLDELENHLRQDLDQQMRAGSDAPQAFDAAVRRIGQARALSMEFAKAGQVMSVGERKLTLILGAICAVGDVLIGVAFLLNLLSEPMPLRERMLGAAAWFSFPVIMGSWMYFYRFLPVISGRRMRLAVAGLSCVAGGLVTAILLRVIPVSASAAGPFDVAVVWAFLPCVIGVTLVFGLEEAAYRKTAVPTS